MTGILLITMLVECIIMLVLNEVKSLDKHRGVVTFIGSLVIGFTFLIFDVTL